MPFVSVYACVDQHVLDVIAKEGRMVAMVKEGQGEGREMNSDAAHQVFLLIPT